MGVFSVMVGALQLSRITIDKEKKQIRSCKAAFQQRWPSPPTGDHLAP